MPWPCIEPGPLRWEASTLEMNHSNSLLIAIIAMKLAEMPESCPLSRIFFYVDLGDTVTVLDSSFILPQGFVLDSFHSIMSRIDRYPIHHMSYACLA
jgi:hypothetical protein